MADRNEQIIRIDYVNAEQSDVPWHWILQAEWFLTAGVRLLKYPPSPTLPAIVLMGYAIELALKGLLLEKKVVGLSGLKTIGHDLSKARTKAIEAGLPDGLLTVEDARRLSALFDDLPGIEGKGKLRAGIYPAKSERMNIAIDPRRFCDVVGSLVKHCANEVPGARDRHREEEERRRLREAGPDTDEQQAE